MTRKAPVFYHRNIIVGSDAHSLECFALLNKSTEDVYILSEAPLSATSIALDGPNQLRGEQNLKGLVSIYPELEFSLSEQKICFYKDLKFKEFGGRAKSEPLLKGEDFFTSPSICAPMAELFPGMNNSEVKEKAFSRQINKRLTKIEIVSPSNFAEPVNFILYCGDNTELHAENLIWCRTPYELTDLLEDSKKISPELLEYCHQTRAYSALYLTFPLKKEIQLPCETFFIPLSFTHEWGHFIGELLPASSAPHFGKLQFVMYLDTNESSEEVISRNIKILKRHLEKIFKNIKEIFGDEVISLSSDISGQKIVSKPLERESLLGKNLFFINGSAPFAHLSEEKKSFDDSVFSSTHLSRALISRNYLAQNLENI